MIALYIRLSTEDSKVGSFSIENQKNALHQYVDAMEGVKNVEVLEFIDNGYSGTNFERPAVQELLDQIREGKINCIIVKDDLWCVQTYAPGFLWEAASKASPQMRPIPQTFCPAKHSAFVRYSKVSSSCFISMRREK